MLTEWRDKSELFQPDWIDNNINKLTRMVFCFSLPFSCSLFLFLTLFLSCYRFGLSMNVTISEKWKWQTPMVHVNVIASVHNKTIWSLSPDKAPSMFWSFDFIFAAKKFHRVRVQHVKRTKWRRWQRKRIRRRQQLTNVVIRQQKRRCSLARSLTPPLHCVDPFRFEIGSLSTLTVRSSLNWLFAQNSPHRIKTLTESKRQASRMCFTFPEIRIFAQFIQWWSTFLHIALGFPSRLFTYWFSIGLSGFSCHCLY